MKRVGGCAPVLLIALLVVLASVLPSGYYIIGPGGTYEIEPRLQVPAETRQEMGRLAFTAVYAKPGTWLEFAQAQLSKDELVAYLAAKANAFTREQKTALLKALLGVFAADGRFDETEHAALVDYTAAVGFDRKSAPEMLRGLTRDFARGTIT